MPRGFHPGLFSAHGPQLSWAGDLQEGEGRSSVLALVAAGVHRGTLECVTQCGGHSLRWS